MSTTQTKVRTPRIDNGAVLVPGAVDAIQALARSVMSAGAPPELLELAHLRASQVNGCSVCVNLSWQNAGKQGGPDERLFMVSAWRDAGNFSDGERAVLALTEAMTRMADRTDPVPDEIWAEAGRHYDHRTLAAVVLWVALTNLFNRVNVTLRQVPGPANW